MSDEIIRTERAKQLAEELRDDPELAAAVRKELGEGRLEWLLEETEPKKWEDSGTPYLYASPFYKIWHRKEWVLEYDGTVLHTGTLQSCQAAAEEHEAKPREDGS